MSRWAQFVATRAYMARLGYVMFAIAFTLAVVHVWHSIELPAEVMFAIFGMWMLSASQMIGHMLAMQSRIDMMLIARGEDAE